MKITKSQLRRIIQENMAMRMSMDKMRNSGDSSYSEPRAKGPAQKRSGTEPITRNHIVKNSFKGTSSDRAKLNKELRTQIEKMIDAGKEDQIPSNWNDILGLSNGDQLLALKQAINPGILKKVGRFLGLSESKSQTIKEGKMKVSPRQLRRIIRESISSQLNEDYGDPIGSGDPVSEILQWAEEGGRVRVAGKNIWPGMGNRSGLHSYADQMVREKWAKSGDRFAKKVESLPVGTEVELQRYKNINRDRGKWITAGTVTIVNAPAAAPQGPQPSKKVRKRMNDILQFVFGNSERIVSVSLYTGSDNPFGRGKVWLGTDADGDTYLFQDDPSATEFARTEKDDEGYWDYLGY